LLAHLDESIGVFPRRSFRDKADDWLGAGWAEMNPTVGPSQAKTIAIVGLCLREAISKRPVHRL
jgi:hypothetical protein